MKAKVMFSHAWTEERQHQVQSHALTVADVPDEGAVNRYQIDAEAPVPGTGSPVSRVAVAVLPVIVWPEVMAIAPANGSLAGRGDGVGAHRMHCPAELTKSAQPTQEQWGCTRCSWRDCHVKRVQ